MSASDVAFRREAARGAARAASVRTIPVAVVSAVLAWWQFGTERAMQEYVVPALIGGVAWAVVFAIVYVVSFWRSVKRINARQIADINRLDAELTKLRGVEAKSQSLEVSISKLRGELAIAQRPFNVGVKHGARYVVWSDDPNRHPVDEFWVVVADLTITNRSNGQLPLDFWVFFGGFSGDMRWGCHAVQSPPPQWVLDQLQAELRGYVFIPSPSNVPGTTTIRGYIAAPFANGQLVHVRNESDARSLVNDSPMWLQVHNNLSDSTQDFTLNRPAAKEDAQRGFKPGKGF